MFYLKYRPKTIEEIDNSRVKTLLGNILNSDPIPHALLFTGQKGTGKTSSARIFAKSLNCLNNRFSKKNLSIEPCNTCKNCRLIDSSSFVDVLEIDAASNRGIEEIKNLIREVSFIPMSGRYRVFIIDEAHMITNDGFNALLKTLEEPPKHAVFIMATTNPEKIPATIMSRSVNVNFAKAITKDIENMLKKIVKREKAELSPEIISLIAKNSDHSFRDAAKMIEEILNQNLSDFNDIEGFIGLKGKNVFISALNEGNQEVVFKWINEFDVSGGNFRLLIESLLDSLKNDLLIRKKAIDGSLIFPKLNNHEITKLIKLIMQASQMMKHSPIESLPLEIVLSEFYNELATN